MGTGGFSQGIRRQGRELNRSSPTGAEIKTMLICTSTPPYAFMEWCLISIAQGQLCLCLCHEGIWGNGIYLHHLNLTDLFECYVALRTFQVMDWSPPAACCPIFHKPLHWILSLICIICFNVFFFRAQNNMFPKPCSFRSHCGLTNDLVKCLYWGLRPFSFNSCSCTFRNFEHNFISSLLISTTNLFDIY
jgi:hypothetical protein